MAGVFGNEDSGHFLFQEVKRTDYDYDGYELSRDYEFSLRSAPRIRTYGPEYAPQEPEARPICKNSELCCGCPYPGHGFVCWGADGSCIRSRIAEINQIEKETDNHASDAMQ